ISIIALLIGLLLPALAGARRKALRINDAANQRSVHTGFILWAQDNNERYPLPSRVDRANAVLNIAGDFKNSTGNVFSMMIFNGSITPDIVVSPAEANPEIVVISEDQYQFRNPERAESYSGGTAPGALWDPGFKGSPDDDNLSLALSGQWTLDPSPGEGFGNDDDRAPEGNNSFAHIPLTGAWLDLWSAVEATANQPILANRGPLVAALGGASTGNLAQGGFRRNDWELSTTGFTNTEGIEVTGETSNTLRIHGGNNTWEGNVTFNDGHVASKNSVTIDEITVDPSTGDDKVEDCLFASEGRDDGEINFDQRTDAFFGIWAFGVPIRGDNSTIEQPLFFQSAGGAGRRWID
ncbi:MAG: hypothetical protein AAGB34_11345, partial [Planctomycetota bacterium]